MKVNFNYLLADFISRFNMGIIRKVRFIEIFKTNLILKILRILYTSGVIRTYIIRDNIIRVYFKFELGESFCSKLQCISTPGKRVYLTMQRLAQITNNSGGTGFYIISTSKGLVTSNFCLLHGYVSGEILIKVDI